MSWFKEEIILKENLGAAFDRVCQKIAENKHRLLEIEGIDFRHLVSYKKQIITEIQGLVGRGTFQMQAFDKGLIPNGDKKRIIYKLHLLDLILHTSAANVLNAETDATLSHQLYSYRKGRSSWQAIRRFGNYVRTHRKKLKSVKDRGLYILRRDIKDYGDSIPVHPSSHLWVSIGQALSHRPLDADDCNFFRALVCPTVVDAGLEMSNLVGLATGSPLSGLLTNIYLSDLDHALSSRKNGIYFRYGDDILYATSNAQEFDDVGTILKEHVFRRKLGFNAAKVKNLFFNGAGRASRFLPGAQYVDFLGLRINFKGELSLPLKKEKLIFADLKQRLKNVSQSSGRYSPDEQLLAACQILNDMFGSDVHKQVPYSDWILRWLDDRGHLRDLDYRIRLRIAQNLTGVQGVRAFRKISPAKLTANGLVSLLKKRNAA